MAKTHILSDMWRTRRARIGGVVASVALASGLATGVAFADSNIFDTTSNNLATSIISLPEYLTAGWHNDLGASDLSQLASDDAPYPSAFDLRHYGGTVSLSADGTKSVFSGGINYVTPVKNQSPFGSCWSFAVCAAAETSMITSLDKADDGQMNGSVNYETAASGDSGLRALAASDLSERHLAYCVFSHPKEYGIYSSQAGEGAFLSSGSTNAGDMIDVGGQVTLGVSAFSAGVGPYPESVVPYTGGCYQVLSPATTSKTDPIFESFPTYEAAMAYYEETWTDEAIAEINERLSAHLTKEKAKPTLSKEGDWSVPDEYTYGAVAELSNSNILESTQGDGLTPDEISAMKRELNEGHPVSVGFFADQSRPGQDLVGGSTFLNTETWAQYTYEKATLNHAVTVVGYDDNYAASNFTHTQYKADAAGNIVLDEQGNPVIDAEKTAATTPAGDGAWIVKNSWGSVDSEDPLSVAEWGIDGSGYFYLSYYDMNITGMESFEFDVSEEAQQRSSFVTAQYDLAMTKTRESLGSETLVKMCNVFGASDDEDGKAYVVRDLGCMTGVANATVTLDVFVMDGDADVETAIEGTPTATVTETFDSAGFHRLSINPGVNVRADQKVAVVQTTVRADGTYEYTYGLGVTKEFADAYNTALCEIKALTYTEVVVNRGESLFFSNDSWTDWVDEIAAIDEEATPSTIAGVRSTETQYRGLAAQYQAVVAQCQAALDQLPADSPQREQCLGLIETYSALAAKNTQIADNVAAFNVSTVSAVDNFSIKLYADEYPSMSLETEAEDLKVGDEFTVEVDMGALTAAGQATLTWSDNLEIVGVVAGEALVGEDCTFNNVEGNGLFSFVANEGTEDGVVAVATFRCTAAGEATVGLKDAVAGKSAGAYDCEIADAKPLSLVVGLSGLKGDANNNGKVNIVDAQITYDFAAGKYSDDQKKTLLALWGKGATADMLKPIMDVNEDGDTDASDALAIQNYIHHGAFGE